jgi:membrane protein required for beta-lactamase induction
MDFLVVVIAYVISVSVTHYDEPVSAVAMRWRKFSSRPAIGMKFGVAIYALVPPLLLGLILYFLSNALIEFIVSLGLLLLAFKSGDQPESLAEYQRQVEQGENTAAWRIAVEELGLESQMYEAGDEGINEGVQAGLGYLFLERFFVPVFWFIAFGAPGVLLVWMVSVLMKDESVDSFAHQVRHALYWFPVRLMAITMALMGSFSHCFPVWWQQLKDFDRDDRVLLITCLKSAIGQDNQETMLDETLTLLKRSQLAWLVGLALWLIFSF